VSTRAIRVLPWALLGLEGLLLVAAIVLAVGVDVADEDPAFVYGGIGLVLGYGGVGALIASRHPRNTIGWLFCGIAAIFAVTAFSEEFVGRGLATGSMTMVIPLAWLQSWLFVLALEAIPLVLLLFPTGRPPSPRWRFLLWTIAGFAALAVLGFILGPNPLEAPERFRLANPTAVEALADAAGAMLLVGGVGSLIAALAALAALVVRFNRSSGDERQQIRWLAYVGLAALVLLIGSFATESNVTVNNIAFFLFFLTLAVGIPGAAGIAILRYRLYEIDVVIRKTLVFGALAAFITGIYVAVVVVIGTRATDSLVPSLVATAIVAALFQPIRRRVTRLANRLVFGRRAEPYEVLARFSDRVGLAYASADVLPRTARVIAEATGARQVEIWLGAGDELRRAAAWPDDGAQASTPHHAEDIRHQDEVLGQIRVWTGPGQPLRPAEEKLVTDLASQTGLVVRNVTLTDALRAKVDELSERARELQESRMRIVQAHDAERRRLERNIHDGAQQHLVALAVKLRLAGATAAKDPAKAAVPLRELRDQTDVALDTLLDLAGGIYPAELEERGIGPALALQARTSGAPVMIDVDGVGRFPIEVEAAVYFVCLEAIQNAAKYARASSVRVRLGREADALTFAVEDDGVGFEVKNAAGGSGLQNMRDRLAAFGGDVDIRSAPGAGTTVAGRILVPAEVRP
jgi:signal transduction histidine kinase